MLLLSVLLGMPNEADGFLPLVYREAKNGNTIADSVRRLNMTGSQSEETNIERYIEEIISKESFPDNPELVKQWMPVISRFSFEWGKMDFDE